MKKQRQIIVISTMIMGKANYVKIATVRQDLRIQVELTTNLKDAKEFVSNPEAREVCGRIFNPYLRNYVVEETLVDWTKSKNAIISGDLE